MAIWNVAAVVLANLEAPTSEEAQGRLMHALEVAGFNVYTEAETGTSLEPFEAEGGTTPEELPY